MFSRTALAVILGGLSFTLSCQSPVDLSDEIDEYASLLNEATAEACDCPQVLGYSGIGECTDALGEVTPEDQDCAATALEGSEDEGKAYLDCANAALRDYADCLADNTSCDDTWYDDCSKDRTDALAACPALPSDVDAAFSACTL